MTHFAKGIFKILFFLFFSTLCFSQTVVTMKKEAGVFKVPCNVNGLNLEFIFDTGASNVTISLTEALFMIKNNYLNEKDILGTSYAQLANGELTENTSILLKSIEIAGLKLKNVRASIVHNLDAPLLLGQSALEKLGSLTIDYNKNILIIGKEEWLTNNINTNNGYNELALKGLKEALNYKIDLNKVEDDQLTIELKVPAMKVDKVTFHLPKMVPGTYSIYDFGRFVTDMKVLDKNGNGLDFKKLDDNSWEILDAKNLDKIVYKVEDTWDTKKDNVVFEPAGTNFTDGKVFVFNNHGIFGFFKGMEYSPMTVEVDRPANFFAGTALKRSGGDNDTDIFEVSDYHKLVDSPIMFAEPDTAIIQVGNAKVLIHTYSPSKKIKSKDLVAEIYPILDAQKEYLGGSLPVDNYAFIIFLNRMGQGYLSGSAGALEHSYSSFYCMFEGEPENIAQSIRDVAAHEFFHIVTPLSIHSEEIHYFDFIDPKMSAHLWLYEGVTEYSAQHVQVKQGLVSIERFLNQISQKMATADYFKNDISFTEMSKTCLKENKDQYANVYLKGALIGMCVDLKLRILSGGKYGIQSLMVDLSKKYGIEKPFKDDQLFDEIAAVSGYPEMKDFMNKYIGGTEALPIASLLKEAGINYIENGFADELSMFGFNPAGGITFDMKKSMLKILDDSYIDDFGKNDLGLKGGDLIKKWDGEVLTLMNIQSSLTAYASKASEGYDLKITVLREKQLSPKEMKKRNKLIKKGKMVEDLPLEELELSGKLRKVRTPQKHGLIVDENANDQQLMIRKSWLGNYKLDKDLGK